jgi:hypothetical protein
VLHGNKQTNCGSTGQLTESRAKLGERRGEQIITFFSWSKANPLARSDVTVLFPTPPLPESTKILCFTVDSLSFTRATPAKSNIELFTFD